MSKLEDKAPHLIGLPPVGVSGKVLGIWAEKADGSRRQLAGPFENLVLDSGLDNTLTAGDTTFPGYVYVSTDTTTPTPSGSGPSSPSLIGGNAGSEASTQAAVTIGSDTYTKIRKTTIATSSIGGATGTWASLQLRTAKANGNNAMQPNTWNFAWTLIKDGSGNPTTVTVLSSERLVVEWAIDFYIKETATVQHATILGNAVDITWRPYNVDDALTWFERRGNQNALIDNSYLNSGSTPVSLTGSPAGTNLRTSGGAGATYTNGSFARAYNFSASTGSAGTINSINANGFVNYQGILDSGIVIISANTFTWQLTVSLIRATDLGIS